MSCEVSNNFIEGLCTNNFKQITPLGVFIILDEKLRRKHYSAYNNIHEAKAFVDQVMVDLAVHLLSKINDSSYLEERGTSVKAVKEFLKPFIIDGKIDRTSLLEFTDNGNIEIPYIDDADITPFVDHLNSVIPQTKGKLVNITPKSASGETILINPRSQNTSAAIGYRASADENGNIILHSVTDVVNANLNTFYDIQEKQRRKITPVQNAAIEFGNFTDSLLKEVLTGDFSTGSYEMLETIKENDSIKKLYKGDDFNTFIDNHGLDLIKLRLNLKDYHVINGDRVKLYNPEIGVQGFADIILIHRETKAVATLDIKSSLRYEWEDREDTQKKYAKQDAIYSALLNKYLPEGYTSSNTNSILYVKGSYNKLSQLNIQDVSNINFETIKKEVQAQRETLDKYISVTPYRPQRAKINSNRFYNQLLSNEEEIYSKQEAQNLIDTYLNERFPDFKGIDRLSDILPSDVGARFTLDAILINSNMSNKGSIYHEAWHRFSQLYLTQDEKKELYTSTRNLSLDFITREGVPMNTSSASFENVEEFLAEEYRKFEQDKEAYDFSKFKEKKSFIQKIFDAIAKVLGFFKGYTIEDYFTNLSNNTFNKDSFSLTNAMFGSLNSVLYRKDGNDYLDNTSGKALTAMISNLLGKKFLIDNTKISDYFTSISSIKQLKNDVIDILGQLSEYTISDHPLELSEYINDINDYSNTIKRIISPEFFNSYFANFTLISEFQTLQNVSGRDELTFDDIDNSSTDDEIAEVNNNPGNKITSEDLLSPKVMDFLVGSFKYSNPSVESFFDKIDFLTTEDGFTSINEEKYNKFNEDNISEEPGFLSKEETFRLLAKEFQGTPIDNITEDSWRNAVNNTPSLTTVYIKLKQLLENIKTGNTNDAAGDYQTWANLMSKVVNPEIPQYTQLISRESDPFYIDGNGTVRANDVINSTAQEQLPKNVETTLTYISTGFSQKYKNYNNYNNSNNKFIVLDENNIKNAFQKAPDGKYYHLIDNYSGIVYYNPYVIISKYGNRLETDVKAINFLNEIGIFVPKTLSVQSGTKDKENIVNYARQIYQRMIEDGDKLFTLAKDQSRIDSKLIQKEGLSAVANILYTANPLLKYFSITKTENNYINLDGKNLGMTRNLPLMIEMSKVLAKYNSYTPGSTVKQIGSDNQRGINYRESSFTGMLNNLSNSKSATEFSKYNGWEFFDFYKNTYLQNSVFAKNIFDFDNQGIRKSKALEIRPVVINEIIRDGKEPVDPLKETQEEHLFRMFQGWLLNRQLPDSPKETSSTEYSIAYNSSLSLNDESNTRIYSLTQGLGKKQFINNLFGYFNIGAAKYIDDIKTFSESPKNSIFTSMFSGNQDILDEFNKLLLNNKETSKDIFDINKIVDDIFTSVPELRNKVENVFNNYINSQTTQLEDYVRSFSNGKEYSNFIKLLNAKKPGTITSIDDVTSDINLRGFIENYFFHDFTQAFEESIYIFGDFTEYKNAFKRQKVTVGNGENLSLPDGHLDIIRSSIGGKLISDLIANNDIEKDENELFSVITGETQSKSVEEQREKYMDATEALTGKRELTKQQEIDLQSYDKLTPRNDGSALVMPDLVLRMGFKKANLYNESQNSEYFSSLIDDYNKLRAYTKVALYSWDNSLTPPTAEEYQLAQQAQDDHKSYSWNKQKIQVSGPTNYIINEQEGINTKNQTSFNRVAFYKMAMDVMVPTAYLKIKTETNQQKTAEHRLFERMLEQKIDFLVDESSSKGHTSNTLFNIYDSQTGNLNMDAIDNIPSIPFTSISTLHFKEQTNKDAYKETSAAGTQRVIQWQQDVTQYTEEIKRLEKEDPSNKKAIEEVKAQLQIANNILDRHIQTMKSLFDYQYSLFLQKVGMDDDLNTVDVERQVKYLIENLRDTDSVDATDLAFILQHAKDTGNSLPTEFSKYKSQIVTLLASEFHKAKNTLKLGGGSFQNTSQFLVNGDYISEGGKKELQGYNIDKKNRKTLHAEAIITFTPEYHNALFNLQQADSIKGNQKLRINQKIENGKVVDIEGFQEKLDNLNKNLRLYEFRKKNIESLEMITQRIPHSSVNFSAFIVPVHMIHPRRGQMIALGTSIAQSMGFDNDADTMPTVIKHLQKNGLPVNYVQSIDENGKIIYNKQIVTEDDFNTFEKEYIAARIAIKNSKEESEVYYKGSELKFRALLSHLKSQYGLNISLAEPNIYDLLENESVLNTIDKVQERTKKKYNDPEGFDLYSDWVFSSEQYNDSQDNLSPLQRKYIVAKSNFLNFKKMLQVQYIDSDIERMSNINNYNKLRKTDNPKYLEDIVENISKEYNIPTEKNDVSPATSITLNQALKNYKALNTKDSLGTFLIACTNMVTELMQDKEFNKQFTFLSKTEIGKQVNAQISNTPLAKDKSIKLSLPSLFLEDKNSNLIPISTNKKVYDFNGVATGEIENSQESLSLLASSLLDMIGNIALVNNLNLNPNTKFAIMSMIFTGATIQDTQSILQSPVVKVFTDSISNGNSLFGNEKRYYFVKTSQSLFDESIHTNQADGAKIDNFGNIRIGPYRILKDDGTLNEFMKSPQSAFNDVVRAADGKYGRKEINDFNKGFYETKTKIDSLKGYTTTNEEAFKLMRNDLGDIKAFIPQGSENESIAKYILASFNTFDTHGEILYNSYLRSTPNNIRLDGENTLINIDANDRKQDIYKIFTKGNGRKTVNNIYASKADLNKFVEKVLNPKLNSLPPVVMEQLRRMLSNSVVLNKRMTNSVVNNFNEFIYSNYYTENRNVDGQIKPLTMIDIVRNYISKYDSLGDTFIEVHDKKMKQWESVTSKNQSEKKLSSIDFIKSLIYDQIEPSGTTTTSTDPMEQKLNNFNNTPLKIFKIQLDSNTLKKNAQKERYAQQWRELQDATYIMDNYNTTEEQANDIANHFKQMQYFALVVNNPLVYAEASLSSLLSESFITKLMDVSYINFKNIFSNKDRNTQISIMQSFINLYKTFNPNEKFYSETDDKGNIYNSGYNEKIYHKGAYNRYDFLDDSFKPKNLVAFDKNNISLQEVVDTYRNRWNINEENIIPTKKIGQARLTIKKEGLQDNIIISDDGTISIVQQLAKTEYIQPNIEEVTTPDVLSDDKLKDITPPCS